MADRRIHPERNDETIRLSALIDDLLSGSYRDSRIMWLDRVTGKEIPITCATFTDGEIILSNG